MAQQPNFYKQYSVAVPLLLVVALGPLAALSIGSKVADEETLARANAGLENYQAPDIYSDYHPPQASSESTVVDITSRSALFDDFQKAIEASGMEPMLETKGPFTVFVPVDRAFDALPSDQRQALMSDKDKLAELVSRHIAIGKLGTTDLIQMDSVQTVGGEEVDLGNGSGPNLAYGGGDIVKGNLAAGNGVVHVVDKLIF